MTFDSPVKQQMNECNFIMLLIVMDDTNRGLFDFNGYVWEGILSEIKLHYYGSKIILLLHVG